jgi:hypothetical protein
MLTWQAGRFARRTMQGGRRLRKGGGGRCSGFFLVIIARAVSLEPLVFFAARNKSRLLAVQCEENATQ